MKTYEYDGAPFTEARSHPWVTGALDPQASYHDFTASPQLIRSSLEDFKPFERYPAIETFYALLERINHPKSPLESNDCAFNAPEPAVSARVRASHECSGRLMLFYRDMGQNTQSARSAWLEAAFHQQLAPLDPAFALGMIGTTRVPVRFLAMPEGEQLGEQLMLSFWAFGGSEASAMQNLARLFKNLTQALRAVSARVASS